MYKGVTYWRKTFWVHEAFQYPFHFRRLLSSWILVLHSYYSYRYLTDKNLWRISLLTIYGEIESAWENLDGYIADLEYFFSHVIYPLFDVNQSYGHSPLVLCVLHVGHCLDHSFEYILQLPCWFRFLRSIFSIIL